MKNRTLMKGELEDLDVAAMSLEELAEYRLALDDMKKLVETRRDAITRRLESACVDGPVVIGDHTFYMMKAGYSDVYDAAATFEMLREAGVPIPQIFATVKFSTKVNTLCDIFSVNLGSAKESVPKKAALGIKKA